MRLYRIAAFVIPMMSSVVVCGQAQTPRSLSFYGAGSLRAPILEIAREYEKLSGVHIEATFGPSGLMRERIEHGERPDVFGSADMESPRKLAAVGLGTPVKAFTANAICAVAPKDAGLTSSNLLAKMLAPEMKIGAGTPVSDPLGDYTEAMFAKADRLHPGAKELLDARAVRLIGGRDTPRVPAGKDSTGYFLLESKIIGIMLTYCSGAQTSVHADPRLEIVDVPPDLAVAAEFGYTVITGAKPEAAEFGKFLEIHGRAEDLSRKRIRRQIKSSALLLPLDFHAVHHDRL